MSRQMGGRVAPDQPTTIPVWAATGVTAVERGPGSCTHALDPAPWLLDQGNVHGGGGVLLGERAAAAALGRVQVPGDGARRLVELRAVYLRPLAADGGPLECRAEVVHLGRRLAAARAELFRPGEPPAVLVDTAYGP